MRDHDAKLKADGAESLSTAGLGVAVPPAPTFNCMECGMSTEANEYHPYAACLMFKGCHDGEVVRANLDAVVAHGVWIESETRQPCDVMQFSSRMCEYGTKGCVRMHTTPN